jgi:hypothetical protein
LHRYDAAASNGNTENALNGPSDAAEADVEVEP